MTPYHYTSENDLQFKNLRLNYDVPWSEPVNDNRMPRSERAKRVAVIVMIVGLILWLLLN